MKLTDKFKKDADDMAKFGFSVMRLFAMEHSMTKEHFVFALSSLCVEVRDTYPDGAAAFDEIAEQAQKHYESTK